MRQLVCVRGCMRASVCAYANAPACTYVCVRFPVCAWVRRYVDGHMEKYVAKVGMPGDVIF